MASWRIDSRSFLGARHRASESSYLRRFSAAHEKGVLESQPGIQNRETRTARAGVASRSRKAVDGGVVIVGRFSPVVSGDFSGHVAHRDADKRAACDTLTLMSPSLYIADEHVILFEETKETINDHWLEPGIDRTMGGRWRAGGCRGRPAGDGTGGWKVCVPHFFVYVVHAQKNTDERGQCCASHFVAALCSRDAPQFLLPRRGIDIRPGARS